MGCPVVHARLACGDGDDELLGEATPHAAHNKNEQLDKLMAAWQRWFGWCLEAHAFSSSVVADEGLLCLDCRGFVAQRAVL